VTDPRLDRLSRLAALVRDARLAEVAAASARLAAYDLQIAALSSPAEVQEDPVLLAAAARHALWAAGQREMLQAGRPPLVAGVEAAAAQARVALSRAEVVERLAEKGRDHES
jgi:hypothetical protein